MAVAFGKYELLKKIASGGMGQVFLAQEHGTGFERLVVLKLILPHLAEDEEFLDMFLEEARLVARLSHPNLITILDLTEIEGRHCLAMEYVQGEDVRRLDRFARKQEKPLPVGLVIRIIADAAAGLSYAHGARDGQGQPLQLVHRDVSPQNVLVGFDGGVKVIDFGVAKAATSGQQTATGVLKGKYPYMSPEQANGQPVDGRSDQFALGVVMWELLTGKRLFKGDTDLMTLRLVRDCQIPPPSQLNPKLPPGLDEVLLKALAPTAEGRYPDCAAFRLALEDYALNLRLPSSSAHLAAYLRGLYAERIATESDPSKLDQLAEDADLDSQSNSSRNGMPTSGARGLASSRASKLVGPPSRPPTRVEPEATRGTAALAPVAPKRRTWLPYVAGGVALMLGGAAVVWLRGTQTAVPPPPVATVTRTPEEAQGHTPPEAPARPTPAQPVRLMVTSEPPGATVQVGGEERGTTPVALPLVPGEPSVAVTLALNGYEPVTRQVSAADAPTVAVALQRRAARPSNTSKKPPPTSSLGIKTGR
ncbi:PEGA domain-containing protein [Corallococcus praedator]|uniref:PEGA domain-containing protein n=2 Tax=Myxococcaceae TaxID=31 RepID=A0ABX9QGZ8_9BACT|nr:MULTISPECIES: serine/threonine-protein kinase [Corallococcus]RKH24975.1 PEGA domain-containing protein [Corallococcus sp. CA031C]RKI05977.1 PEGA domain-containing protein [Corallococcus praedator]